MNKIKRFIHKDRYGIVRGTIVMCAILLSCSLVFANVLYIYDSEAQKERADSAVIQVCGEFELAMQDAFMQLDTSVTLAENMNNDPQHMLQHVMSQDIFIDAALLDDGMLIRADGTSVSAGTLEAQLMHGKNNVLVNESEIMIFKPINEDQFLIGWIRTEYLCSVLSKAVDGNYGYAVYNNETGAYMIDEIGLGGGSYYSALLELNEDGSLEELLSTENAQAFFNNRNAGPDRICIAQHNTRLHPWGISLVIPAEQLAGSGWDATYWQGYVICAGILMMFIMINCAIFALRRIRHSNKNAARALESGERMMGIVAQDAGVTIVEYHRGQNGLIACYDGLGLMGQRSMMPVIRTWAALEESCDMDAAQAEQLQQALRDLKAGESTELQLRCGMHDHQEHVLQFALYASGEQENGILCCIRDCTQEQAYMDRAALEENYRNAIAGKTSFIWQVNISRNRWQALHIKDGFALCGIEFASGKWRDYSSDLSGRVREYMHPADYEAFADAMSIVSIASMFRSGKTEFSMDCRASSDGSSYKWHRMRVRIWLHPESGDILANLYLFNVDAEKNAEMERGERKKILHKALTAMGGIYSGLYYVDLDRNLSYTARAMDGELVTSLCAPFKETFDQYIRMNVHPDDRGALENMLSAYNLRRNMTEGTHFQRLKYRRRIGDHYDTTLAIVQPARFENGTVKEVVIAFRYLKTKEEMQED